MSSEIAIKVENLSKCYQIYDKPHDRLKQMVFPRLQRLLGQPAKVYHREFWALKNVSFEIKKGETVGIIGRNGSGKSTLLQMICGTLNPSSGSIHIQGRIAALLELGAGFNPEFTGRENVYMNAAVLGLGKTEIDTRFDDIVAFADIGEFIEQPVKTYSSGMMVRLAFAVSINVDPEVLIVDEALSVGDELFQRKCFSRIEAIRDKGATILFVSHSGGQIVELCDRAVLLDAGEKLAIGHPKQIVGRYQKLLYAPAESRQSIREQIARTDSHSVSVSHIEDLKQEQSVVSVQQPEEVYDPYLVPVSTISYDSHGAQIQDVIILNLAGEKVNHLRRGGHYRYQYRVRFARSATNVRFGMMIKTVSGTELGGSVSAASQQDSLAFVEIDTSYLVEFRFKCHLNSGTYFLNAGVVGDIHGSETYLHRLVDAAMFKVLPEAATTVTSMVDFECVPEIELDESELWK